jgi:L-alanine-DL-glutamate epimerase-like enolase superfamily enzyme
MPAYREGLILRLETDDGIVGLGEASPLPEDGEGALQKVLAILDLVGNSLIDKKLDEVDRLPMKLGQDHGAFAAVRCALDVAACDARAKAVGSTVAELLAPHVRRSIVVNATVGARLTADACEAARKARDAGFCCVKLKVGMAHSIDEECRRVAAVRDAVGPQVKLLMRMEPGKPSKQSG